MFDWDALFGCSILDVSSFFFFFFFYVYQFAVGFVSIFLYGCAAIFTASLRVVHLFFLYVKGLLKRETVE